MNAEEKARELVDSFKPYSGITMSYQDLAKQCALIAVDEILNVLSNYPNDSLIIKHWQQVKADIEKL